LEEFRYRVCSDQTELPTEFGTSNFIKVRTSISYAFSPANPSVFERFNREKAWMFGKHQQCDQNRTLIVEQSIEGSAPYRLCVFDKRRPIPFLLSNAQWLDVVLLLLGFNWFLRAWINGVTDEIQVTVVKTSIVKSTNILIHHSAAINQNVL